MTKELFDLMKKLDIQSPEVQLALRCAPLLAGLKCSNLLILKKVQSCRIRRLIAHTTISGYSFYQSETQEFLLLYQPSQLAAHLLEPKAAKILSHLEYPDHCLQSVLRTFAKRYQSYRSGNSSFPHEMGLLLGYPPGDVYGFIEHHGADSLCTGYWKVYEHVPEKEALFHKFDVAKEQLIRMLAAGVSMREMMESLT